MSADTSRLTAAGTGKPPLAFSWQALAGTSPVSNLTGTSVWWNTAGLSAGAYTLSLQIRDSMCGFRVYPLAEALAEWDGGGIGRRMQFDTDILVRLYWRGLRVINVPVRVTYPLDGVSHFRMVWYNVLMVRLQLKLFLGMLVRLPLLLWRKVS